MSDWWGRANCRGMDPGLFFESLGNQFKAARPLPEAVNACQECQVRDECYVYAIRHEEFGYWAGTTPPERRRLRKEHGITLQRQESVVVQFTSHGTEAGFKRHHRMAEQPCENCKAAHAQYKSPNGTNSRIYAEVVK